MSDEGNNSVNASATEKNDVPASGASSTANAAEGSKPVDTGSANALSNVDEDDQRLSDIENEDAIPVVIPPPSSSPFTGFSSILSTQEESATSKLHQVKLLKLKSEYVTQFKDISDATERDLRVNAAMEKARECLPHHEEVVFNHRVAFKQAQDTKKRLQKALQTAQVAVNDDARKIALNKANRIAKDLEANHFPDLKNLSMSATQYWYRPCSEPTGKANGDLRDEVDDLLAQVDALAPAPVQSVAAPSSSTITLAPAPKMVNKFDITEFVKPNFSGEGGALEALQAFRVFQDQLERAMNSLKEYQNVDDSVRLDKLRRCLAGKALELANKIPAATPKSFELVLQLLRSRYEDPFALAGAYVDTLPAKQDGALSASSEAQESAIRQLEALRPVLLEQDVDPLELVIIHQGLKALPAAAQANWKSQLSAAKDRGDKLGKVLNTKDYLQWLRTYAVAHPETTQESAEVFLASGNIQTKRMCPFHGGHGAFECRDLLTMRPKDWFALSKSRNICARCLGPWNQGHNCNGRCNKCRGRHLTLRCALDSRPIREANSNPRAHSAGPQHKAAENKALEEARIEREVSKRLAARLVPSHSYGEPEKKRPRWNKKDGKKEGKKEGNQNKKE